MPIYRYILARWVLAMPKRGRPKSTAPAPAKKKPTVERTAQTPFEAAQAGTEKTYGVDRIAAVRYIRGVKQYLVEWTGYDPIKECTWEPMENLVGVAAEIREYERRREAEELEANEHLLEKRRKAREEADKQAKELREAAAAAAEGDTGAEAADDTKKLRVHRQKTHPMWGCFDLSVPTPTCKLPKGNCPGQICGIAPSTKNLNLSESISIRVRA
ncbi:hypothetical protein AB1Y20_015172 [Prymnesium parvum]|uniref:Chromo domain-containing protein n=1 Tax=Prymnesium parvum TaxID=97485 RepID=A0AB34JZC3_PRYPA